MISALITEMNKCRQCNTLYNKGKRGALAALPYQMVMLVLQCFTAPKRIMNMLIGTSYLFQHTPLRLEPTTKYLNSLVRASCAVVYIHVSL